METLEKFADDQARSATTVPPHLSMLLVYVTQVVNYEYSLIEERRRQRLVGSGVVLSLDYTVRLAKVIERLLQLAGMSRNSAVAPGPHQPLVTPPGSASSAKSKDGSGTPPTLLKERNSTTGGDAV